ncbi:hypothetical protein QPK87_14165 [Kamptonema cortianum]|nr:hypothetical protein [Geitlerinema splendidum]MDK3157713.1 hypothetical protein [Kamptonema cortianum]
MSQAPASSAVTYSEHIEPIMAAKCVPCHADGSVAPFKLDSYELVRKHSGLVRFQSMSKAMPPIWATSERGKFGAIAPLTDEEIVLIQRWMQGGMQEGVAQVSPKPSSDLAAWKLDKKNITLDVFSASDKTLSEGAPYWRIQSVPLFGTAINLRGFYVEADAPSVVRSVSLAWVPANHPLAIAKNQESFGSMNLPGENLIGVWAPGYAAWQLPENAFLRIPADATLIAQVLYRPTGKAESSRVRVHLQMSATPKFRVHWRSADYGDFVIPAGASPVMKLNLPIAAGDKILAVWPEARFYATRYRVLAESESAKPVTLFDTMRWDPYWIGNYSFEEPIVFGGGTKLTGEVGYSNDDRCLMNEDRTPEPVPSGSGVRQEVFRLHVLVMSVTE